VHVHPFKRWLQSTELIEYNSKRPNVTLEGVRTPLDYFRAQIVRSTDHRLRDINGVLQNAGDTEITDLNLALLRQEEVLALQVTMEHFSIMNVLQAEAHLGKPIKDLRL